MISFRTLYADEIECRVGQCGETKNGDKFVTLLLYKDARCDMNILDETVGPENWGRKHYECKGNLYCEVGINTNYDKCEFPDRWVWKSDCGSESNTEAEKGEASDSFKRACVNWGIGRELYTSPFVYIKADQFGLNVYKKQNGKYECKENFVVSRIDYDEKRRICSLEIKVKDRVVFSFCNNRQKNNVHPQINSKASSEQVAEIVMRIGELANIRNADPNTVTEQLMKKCRISNNDMNDWSELEATQALSTLKSWKEMAKAK